MPRPIVMKENTMRILHRMSTSASTERAVFAKVSDGRSTLEMRKLKSRSVLLVLGMELHVMAPISTDTITLDTAKNVTPSILDMIG